MTIYELQIVNFVQCRKFLFQLLKLMVYATNDLYGKESNFSVMHYLCDYYDLRLNLKIKGLKGRGLLVISINLIVY